MHSTTLKGGSVSPKGGGGGVKSSRANERLKKGV